MNEDAIGRLRRDPELRPLVDEHGPLAVEPAEDTFRRIAGSIVNQQLSGASAAAIRDRLYDRFEITPRAVLAADDEALRETGLSASKVRYLKAVAEAYLERELSAGYFADLSDDEVTRDLVTIPGVGPWTAKMFLIFCLGREDVFPVEDLGIRRAMCRLFDDDMTRDAMVETAERWRPYRSYATRYLWRVVD